MTLNSFAGKELYDLLRHVLTPIYKEVDEMVAEAALDATLYNCTFTKPDLCSDLKMYVLLH